MGKQTAAKKNGQTEMSAGERIRREVNRIRGIKSGADWKKFLSKKGGAHHAYYHYTTLSSLKAMLESSFWQLTRADRSNDPNEQPVHNASFTSSSLSSMGMWKMYSKLGAEDDFGVRIKLPKEVFKNIFLREKLRWYCRNADGDIVPCRDAAPGPAEVYDMAYWHFGQNEGKNVAYYRNYELPGNALDFHFKPDKKLPEYFKCAIWRQEGEIRVCRMFTNWEELPVKLYLKIEPEDFRQMEFKLSPDIFEPKAWDKYLSGGKLKEQLPFFLSEIFAKRRIGLDRISLPGEKEEYQVNG